MTPPSKPPLPEALRLPALTLAAHAYESQRASGLMTDETAARWLASLQERYEPFPLPDLELVNGIITRSLVIDYALLALHARQRRLVVTDLGCGFSTRRYRLPILVRYWVHIDKIEVLQVRSQLQQMTDNELALGRDLSELDSLEALPVAPEFTNNHVFLLEGVLNHLPKEPAKALVGLLRARYQGGSLIGTVITEKGRSGALSGAQALGLDPAMWTIADADELIDFLTPSKLHRIWLLGKVASRLGLIRPATGDEASGFAFLATL